MNATAGAPRYPLEGVVSWNMNTTCNYRCSYCTQRFVDNRKQWARDLPRFVEAFISLPGDWEIKLSGGEPFQHPGFSDAVEALVSGGLRVSVVTNLSSRPEVLEAYVRATAARPGVLSASMHLEYVDADAFLQKALWLNSLHAGRLVVTCVATRENLSKLPALQETFGSAGVPFRVQPEKQDRDVIAYTAAERELLVSLGGHNGTGWIEPDLSGRLCWAGARYFIVDHQGEAYRCYPARRADKTKAAPGRENTTMRLGNLLDGSFRLEKEAATCPYHYCNCTVPQQRGMVAMN